MSSNTHQDDIIDQEHRQKQLAEHCLFYQGERQAVKMLLIAIKRKKI